jgi:cholesterol oxidase
LTDLLDREVKRKGNRQEKSTVDKSYDVIVVGSGFGGAVSACRLAGKGMKVLMLERGRRWRADTYPSVTGRDWIFDPNRPEKLNGWLDLRLFGNMSVAQGAGVGGGSLIYANVFITAKPETFDVGWPQEVTYRELLPYYEMAGRMLKVQRLPEGQLTERYKLMREGADRIRRADRFEPVELAVNFDDQWHYGLDDPFNYAHSKRFDNAHGQRQGTCVHCGNCDIGCPVDARNTLDFNYIAEAEKHGAEIRPLHQAFCISQEAGAYRVHFNRYENGQAIAGSEAARRVVLAAGSLGSTELLLLSRDHHKTLPGLSRRLGYGWCSNGDFLTPSFHPTRSVTPTRGPTITCAIDLLDGVEEGASCYIEDGGFPDVFGNYLQGLMRESFFTALNRKQLPLSEWLARVARSGASLEHIMPWFGQAVDAPAGHLYLARPWYAPWQKKKLCMRWDYRPSETVMNGIANIHRRLAETTAGLPFTPIGWAWFKALITPHPLGGCNMGNSAGDGVVNHRGEVFNYPNLYVADGAIVPRAIGLNPSRTIAALAERNAALMLLEAGG